MIRIFEFSLFEFRCFFFIVIYCYLFFYFLFFVFLIFCVIHLVNVNYFCLFLLFIFWQNWLIGNSYKIVYCSLLKKVFRKIGKIRAVFTVIFRVEFLSKPFFEIRIFFPFFRVNKKFQSDLNFLFIKNITFFTKFSKL